MDIQPIRRKALISAKWGAFAISALCLIAGMAPGTARADIMVIMHTSMQSPIMKNLPATARADLDSLSQSTVYVSGKKYRVTSPLLSMIIDRDSNQLIMLNDRRKTYIVMPFDPATAGRLAPMGPGAQIPNGTVTNFTIVDTGRSTTLLGHKVRHYVETVDMTLRNEGVVTTRSDILAAQDFPEQEMETFNSLAVPAPGDTQVKGVPLKTVTMATGGIMGTMTTTQEVISISTKPIPSYFFTIPEGYTQEQQRAPQGAPGAPQPTQ